MDQEFLLALLNTTPVVNGTPTDELGDAEAAGRWLRAHELPGSGEDWEVLREGRDLLQAVVRGQQTAGVLAPLLRNVRSRPSIGDDGLSWTVDVGDGQPVVVEAVIAWDELQRSKPGRLRPCANDECGLFLLDQSKSNSARWCSMATCGNKLKARRHYQRTRESDTTEA
jgi:predicted RNA-binding Zn ribbon-like protein